MPPFKGATYHIGGGILYDEIATHLLCEAGRRHAAGHFQYRVSGVLGR